MSIDFICKLYGLSHVHGVITVCMLGYYNDMLVQASFVFLDPMTSRPSLQHTRAVFRHFNCPLVDDPNAACSTHCYSVAVEQYWPKSSAVTRTGVCLTTYPKTEQILHFAIYKPRLDY